MLVTDDGLVAGRDLVDLARGAVRGGITSVQLRLKRVPAGDLVALARQLRAALPVPVIVNDRPDVAWAAGCWVHLGPEDLPVAVARRIAPGGAIIGASVGSVDEVEPAADYWGVGPFRATGTKGDAGAAIGAEGVRRIVALAAGRPCVAIGGIRPEDVGSALEAGAVGVAVASGILGAEDPEAAAGRYAAMLK
jgi:thiamine-phosphate pyrophosphorylase